MSANFTIIVTGECQLQYYLIFSTLETILTLTELPPAPVDVQTSCNLIIWRNAPNISYEDIIGYEIKLINLANNEEVMIDLDASATFYDLDELEDETIKHESTFIQVIIQCHAYPLIVNNYDNVCCLQIRVVSTEQSGLFSSLKSLGNVKSVVLQLGRIHHF